MTHSIHLISYTKVASNQLSLSNGNYHRPAILASRLGTHSSCAGTRPFGAPMDSLVLAHALASYAFSRVKRLMLGAVSRRDFHPGNTEGDLAIYHVCATMNWSFKLPFGRRRENFAVEECLMTSLAPAVSIFCKAMVSAGSLCMCHIRATCISCRHGHRTTDNQPSKLAQQGKVYMKPSSTKA